MKKQILTKEEVISFKGVAILLMLVHHLFGFPERISETNNYQTIFPMVFSNSVEYYIAIFSKICVGIFLFLGGIGFFSNTNKSLVKNIKKIYIKYWIVFLIFIPLGVYMKKIYINWYELIINFFGMNSTYNGEWWFLRIYILILILYFSLFGKKSEKHFIKIVVGSSFLYIVAIFFNLFLYNIKELVWIKTMYIYKLLYGVCYYQIYFMSGIFYCYYIEKIRKKITPKIFKIIIILSFLFLILRVKYSYIKILEFIIVPIYFELFINFFNKKKYYCFEILGKYSTYMWLTHSFYCYYYYQELIYFNKNPLIITITLLLTSLITAIFLEIIEKNITGNKGKDDKIFFNKKYFL